MFPECYPVSQTPIYARLAVPALLLSALVAVVQMVRDEPPQIQTAGESVTCAGVRCEAGSGR